MSGPLAFPKPTTLFIGSHQSVFECCIMKYKEAWKGGEQQRKQETQQQSISWFCLLSCLGGFLTIPLPTNLLDREANSLSSFPEWKTTSTGCCMPSPELNLSQALVGPGREAKRSSCHQAPASQELFSYYAAKVESLKGCLFHDVYHLTARSRPQAYSSMNVLYAASRKTHTWHTWGLRHRELTPGTLWAQGRQDWPGWGLLGSTRGPKMVYGLKEHLQSKNFRARKGL